MPKKEKAKRIDGLGTYEITKISSAVRQVWQRSLARQIAVKRCTQSDGFLKCEHCGVVAPKIKIDHIIPVGSLKDGFMERLFCPSTGLQGLCNDCHKAKTKLDNQAIKAAKANLERQKI